MEIAKKSKFHHLSVASILVIGCLIRLILLGHIPGGINQDEARAGYEAYSLLHFGVDSWGYRLPVYFISWGSGMNVLYSYLTIPFMALFGNHLWVIRIPQALISCASLFSFYIILKKLFKNNIAVIGLFILAICPWNIMLARWGLESNLAPGLLIIGIMFSVLSFENNKYLIPMFLVYGITMYAYATVWVIIPFLILFQFVYAWAMKKIKLNRYLFIGLALFVILVRPLWLYILVNLDMIEEIRTGLFSVPRMLYYRGNELNFSQMPQRFYNLFRMLTTQNDGLMWNTTEEFGLYYKFSMPFVLLGIYGMGRSIITHIREKSFSPEIYMLIPGVLAFGLGGIIDVNVNRINSIHFSMLLFIAYGIYTVGKWFTKDLAGVVLTAYCISFVFFLCFYCTSYNDRFSDGYSRGVGEAIEAAMTKEGEIHVTTWVNYSVVMYYSEIAQQEFEDTVVYSNYPSAYLSANSFGRFVMGYDMNNLEEDSIYVIRNNEIDGFRNAGYEIEEYDYCAVAY